MANQLLEAENCPFHTHISGMWFLATLQRVCEMAEKAKKSVTERHDTKFHEKAFGTVPNACRMRTTSELAKPACMLIEAFERFSLWTQLNLPEALARPPQSFYSTDLNMSFFMFYWFLAFVDLVIELLGNVRAQRSKKQ